jgi:hypothetical protein
MAVWGTTGGPGKTAAIHEVYVHPSVTSKYGFRAWVRLIQPFNPKDFIHSMVRQSFENFHDKPQGGEEVTNVGASVLLKMEKMNQSDLVHTLTAQLSSNSYLIVINDLRTVEEWQCIRRFFPDNKKQSRIIVSTQEVEVASLCTEQPYQMSELKRLPYDQTLYLFHKKVILHLITYSSYYFVSFLRTTRVVVFVPFLTKELRGADQHFQSINF